MSAALRPSINWLGNSDMGRHIAAFGWHNHPLGRIDNWPDNLKTTLQIMLNSRYAMWLGWGTEFYFFCNDACLPILGIKRNCLGVPAREVWREIWNDIGPRAQTVVATGQATWDESLLLFLERSGYSEETYHTFSYSAVPDDSGNTGGMLCIVTEDTHKVVGERRLALLRELGAELTGIKSEQQVLDAIPRLFNAYQKDLPFSLVYIFDSDGAHARLATAHGVQKEKIAPTIIEIASNESIWPAARIRAEAKPILVADIAARTQQIPAGPWSVPPDRALVVPLGRQSHEKPAGFFVAGVSSYRPFDSDYRGFIQLLAGQIAAALSSVRAYEAERSRAVYAPTDSTRYALDLPGNARSAELGAPVTRSAIQSKPRLLLAAASSDMRDEVIQLLYDDYDIEAVADGEAALRTACAHRPDLIVADVMMPRLDGLQLLHRLRGETTTCTLPVLLLSARADNESRLEGLRAGADDYLIQPFSAAELQARIAGLLKISALRREADQAIRKTAEERQKFAALVEHSQNFIAMASLDGAVIYMNPSARALIGLGAGEDSTSISIRDYFPAAAQEFFDSTVLPKVLEEGRWEGEVEFQHLRSRELLPMYQTFFLIRYPEDGGPLCLATVARNISAQQKAQAELRASEERYRELLHSLPGAVYTCDAQGRITLFNAAAIALWARKPDLGKDAWCGSVRIYRPDGHLLPLDQYPIALALKHGRAIDGEEIVIERPDGTRRHALAYPQPLFDASGAVVGAINMLVDITDRKIAEDALRASEEHLRLVTQAGSLGIWDWDIVRNLITWSDSLYAIHGLKPGEFGGTVEAFAELLHPEDRQFVSAAIHAAVIDGTPFEIEFRILRPGGEAAWIFTNAKVLQENGRASRMIGATVDISERKRSENALRDSEERIKQLVTLMPAAIYTCDPAGRITFFNRRAAELWGHEPCLGELFTGAHRLWWPDGTLLPAEQTPMAAALRQGESVHDAELIIERRDGSRVAISANIEPFHDRLGQCTGAISVFQNISERKTAEQKLQRRSQTIQLLSETLAQLLRANDPDRIVENLFDKVAAHIGADSYLNFMLAAEGTTLTLHASRGIPEERVKEISPPDFAQAICGTVTETQQPIMVNDIQNSADEKAVIIRGLGIQTYACSPLMVGDNLFGTLAFASHTRKCFDEDELEFLRIVSQYTAIALDRLRSARALRGSEDQLAAELISMQQLHTMTTRLMAMREIPAALHEVLGAVIEIQGADFGKIRVYNPALNGLEIVAQQGFEQSFIERHQVVTLEDDSASGRALRTKTRVVIEDVQSDAGTAADRRRAALAGYRAVQATPLISRGGDLLGMLLTHFRLPRRPTDRELRFVDLYARQAADFIELLQTKQELHESEERLRRQAEELEQQLIASGRLVSLGEITASMAHEFNNPLGIVLGFTEDLLSSAQPGDAIYRPLQIIEDEAKRCKRIIQDLMDYSRPRAANLSRTNIHDIVTKTLSLVENRLYKQKINLTTNIAPDLPRLHADYQQLEQVLVNFYLNALDAMPRGGKLAVSAAVQGGNGEASLAIAVSDTGFGIEKDALARIFQPFYTAKKTRGLGLGLPICERIIKNHGGRIEVESTVGQGTTFKIVLPLSRELL